MAAQQGFEYEKNAASILKPMNLVPKNFVPAGAGHDQPDLVLQYKGKKSGCELKLMAASAGSLVLKYDTKNKKTPWGFGTIKPDEREKLFLVGIAKEIGLFETLAKKWSELPYKREPDQLWEATAGKLTDKQRYERDLKTFPDVITEVPATKIEKYYNTKDTFYVNIGTHGFYTFGPKDPFSLNSGLKRVAGRQPVPSFGSSARATARARVQYKGSGKYQFTFELQFRMIHPSPYNIAPIVGKTPVINKKKLNISCFV